MLELYQFELSHYCEKVRLILDYKGLEYRKIEVTPGIGQLDLYKLSGQRQVPVLKDGNEVIADSTAIAMYLERTYPDRHLIPDDPQQKGLCLMMEAWADDSIGLKARKALLGAFNQDQSFRTAVLPDSVPDFVKNLVGALPSDIFSILGTGIGLGPDSVKEAKEVLKQDLKALTLILQNRPYLLGDQPTLADFAVAGMTMYIKFPAGNYLDIPSALKGKGVPGLADNPEYAAFWDWRDRLYSTYRQTSTFTASTSTGSTGSSSPNRIEID